MNNSMFLNASEYLSNFIITDLTNIVIGIGVCVIVLGAVLWLCRNER